MYEARMNDLGFRREGFKCFLPPSFHGGTNKRTCSLRHQPWSVCCYSPRKLDDDCQRHAVLVGIWDVETHHHATQTRSDSLSTFQMEFISSRIQYAEQPGVIHRTVPRFLVRAPFWVAARIAMATGTSAADAAVACITAFNATAPSSLGMRIDTTHTYCGLASEFGKDLCFHGDIGGREAAHAGDDQRCLCT